MRLLALAIALFLIPQDEKITLAFNPTQGDKLTKTTKMQMALEVSVDAGGETRQVDIGHRGTEKVVLQVVEVAAGKLTKLTKHYLDDYKEDRAPGREWTRKDRPTHGRKITISKKDGKLVREGAEGLEEKELKKLDLEDRDHLLLPKVPIKIGDEWEVRGEDVRKYMDDEDIKDGKIRLKLFAIREIDKRRCALIQATLELAGTVEGDMEISLKAEADLVVWIDRGYTLDFKGTGKVKMKGERNGVSMSGEGPIAIDGSTKVE